MDWFQILFSCLLRISFFFSVLSKVEKAGNIEWWTEKRIKWGDFCCVLVSNENVNYNSCCIMCVEKKIILSWSWRIIDLKLPVSQNERNCVHSTVLGKLELDI